MHNYIHKHWDHYCNKNFRRYLMYVSKSLPCRLPETFCFSEMLKSKKFEVTQLVNKLSTKHSYRPMCNKQSRIKFLHHYKKYDIPRAFIGCAEYESVIVDGLRFSVSARNVGDCYFQHKKHVYEIQNIIRKDQLPIFLCKRFSGRQPLFRDPLNSFELNIFFVYDLSVQLFSVNYQSVICKGMVFPFKEKKYIRLIT